MMLATAPIFCCCLVADPISNYAKHTGGEPDRLIGD